VQKLDSSDLDAFEARLKRRSRPRRGVPSAGMEALGCLPRLLRILIQQFLTSFIYS